jgi:hypothetical protein
MLIKMKAMYSSRAVEAFLNCFGENYPEAHPFRPKLHLRSERGDQSNEDRLIIFRSPAFNLDDSVGSGSNSRFRAGASLDGDRMVPERHKGRNKVPSQYTKLRLVG